MAKTILALLCTAAALLPAQTASIRVDARQKLHRITPRFIGVNMEDLNFQTYGGLYSQLLHGEAFQENVDSAVLGLSGQNRLKVFVGEDDRGQTVLWGFRGRNWENNTAREVLGLPAKTDAIPVSMEELPATLREKLTTAPQVSREWRGFQTGGARAEYRFERNAPYLGHQSQRITFAGGTGEAGIDNAGLNRLGINLVAGKVYEGSVRIQAGRDTDVFVSLLDSAGKKLAEKALHVAAGREYRKLDFTLTPPAGDTAGRFAVALKRPGSIAVGYAFLEAGPWGRFQGLPIRKDLAEALLAMGVKVVRYDGSMVNKCPDGQLYKWKEMIGPRDQRKPYHGFFDPYASHGFAVFEFLDFCEKAGLLGIPGLRIDETPEAMAEFVEYAKGPANSTWGRKRITDGHPAPYKLTHVEIGNEERLDEHYCERFETLGRALWAKDPSLVLVISYNIANGDDLEPGADGSLSPRLQLALRLVRFAQQHKGTIWWDSHYSRADRITAIGRIHNSIAKLTGYNLPFSPLEENGATHDLGRALLHAKNQNAFARLGDFIVALGVANTFQAYGQELIWSQGRICFTPSKIFPQPPYLVDQLVTETWAPQMVAASVNDNRLDLVSRLSEDGRRLVIYAVNDGAEAVDAAIKIDGFAPRSGNVMLAEISGDPKTENTPEEPAKIAPHRSTAKYAPGMVHRFPQHSYTVIQFE